MSEIPSTWWYIVPLKIKETDLEANSINSTKTFLENEGTDVKWLRYKKPVEIETTKQY